MSNTVLYSERFFGPQLLIVKGGTMKSVTLDGEVTVGRHSKEKMVDIDLDADFVSRAHGKFMCGTNGCFYMDTHSSNGTYYNGTRLEAGAVQRLTNGDVLHIYNGSPQTADDVITMIMMFDHPAGFTAQTIDLTETTQVNIGRRVDADITVSSQAISADHAMFFVSEGRWALADKNSTNGVFLNNCRVAAPVYINVGDCIRIVNINFVFLGDRIIYQNVRYDQQGTNKCSTLEIHIVQRTVRKLFSVHALLRDINVTFRSGEMILILGGSGAGKTTLVNAILGYEKAEGKILYDNVDLYADDETVQNKISFVPQSDLMRGFDSVYHTLRNAAQLKLPDDMPDEEIEKKVYETLTLFKLDKVESSLVKQLSGGERKRLSVAIEYIADPEVFFLDEPDSGIDGHYTVQLMAILRKIADEGKIIVIISHGANRIAHNFDKVLVLAKSKQDQCGYVSFFGTVEDSYKFFDTDNLEAIVGKVNDQPDYFIGKFKGLYS